MRYEYSYITVVLLKSRICLADLLLVLAAQMHEHVSGCAAALSSIGQTTEAASSPVSISACQYTQYMTAQLLLLLHNSHLTGQPG